MGRILENILKNLKKFFSQEVLIILLLINTSLHYCNFLFEKVDLPNATKKLVIDTIKNELDLNRECAKENCKKEIKNLENVLDEISYANQLGRLDTISLLLALFALVLGFGAVAGFMHIKDTSETIAEKSARKWLDSENGKKQIKDSLHDWITNNQNEMNKIITEIAKNINQEKAKSTTKKEAIKNESDLKKSTQEEDPEENNK
jgi:hypothetical protein